MNFLTGLTLLRIPLALFIVYFLLERSYASACWALALAAFAGFSDWMDGFLARRLRQTSALGALLDPIADKALVLSVLTALAYLKWIPLWIVLVIAGRELLVTGVRLAAASRHLVLSAAPEGKAKTFCQMASILFLLVARVMAVGGHSGDIERLLRLAGMLLLWAALALTVISGTAFFVRNGSALKRIFRSPRR